MQNQMHVRTFLLSDNKNLKCGLSDANVEITKRREKLDLQMRSLARGTALFGVS